MAIIISGAILNKKNETNGSTHTESDDKTHQYGVPTKVFDTELALADPKSAARYRSVQCPGGAYTSLN